MWQKSNETNFLFTKVFIFFKHQCYPLQNSYLGQLHTEGDVPTFGSSAGSLQPVWVSACPLYSLGCFLQSQNDDLSITSFVNWNSSNYRRNEKKLELYIVDVWIIQKLHGIWNSEVHCRIHNGSPIIAILSRINPIPRIETYFFRVHSNISPINV